MFFDYDRIEFYDEETERYIKDDAGKERDVTRIISARLATPFERGLYYGKSD